MNLRILLIFALSYFTAISSFGQCTSPSLTADVNNKVVITGTGVQIIGTSDCEYDLEIPISSTGNSANKSINLTISWAGGQNVNCIGSLDGDVTSVSLPTFTAPCGVEFSVSYDIYDNNAGCGGGQGSCGSVTVADGDLILDLQLSLPVELTTFQANKERFHQVQLEWVTASEENNAMFSIEHSTDGRAFTELAKVEGKGTTNVEQYYTYMDKFPASGANYYRLKQVDFDGSFVYSETISIDIDKNTTKPFVIANSLSKDEITLIFNDTPHENARVEIFNTAGIVLYQNKINAETAYFSVDVSTYEPGMYFVRVPVGKEYLIERFTKIGE